MILAPKTRLSCCFTVFFICCEWFPWLRFSIARVHHCTLLFVFWWEWVMLINGRNSEDARTELALVLDNLFKFLSPEQVVGKLFKIYCIMSFNVIFRANPKESAIVCYKAYKIIQYLVFISNGSYNPDCSSHPTSRTAPTHLSTINVVTITTKYSFTVPCASWPQLRLFRLLAKNWSLVPFPRTGRTPKFSPACLSKFLIEPFSLFNISDLLNPGITRVLCKF